MNKTIFPLLILLCAATNLVAQEEALTKTVEVSRSYEPTIPEAYKINPIPRIDDSSEVTANFTYPLRQTKPLDEDYLINPIPPARIQRERYDSSDEKSRGYVRVGFGVKTSTLLDAYYGSERERKLVWDVFANHYGNYGDIKNAAKEKVPNLNMRNEIGASGQYNLKRGLLYAKAGFHRHDLRLYGYRTEWLTLDQYEALPNDSMQQAYNHTHFTLAYLGFGRPDSSWAYGGKFNFYDYRSRLKQAEDALEFKLFANKKITPTTKLGATFNADIYLRNNELSNLGNAIISIAPEAVETRESWEATVKLNLTFDNVSGEVNAYFYPVLNFTALLADKAFCPYVEVSGEHTANTYKSLTYENPYLTQYVYFNQNSDVAISSLRNMRQTVSFQGGMKGHIGSMFGYDFGLSYAFVDDMHFFVSAFNNFDVLYDDVKRFTLKGNLRFQPKRTLAFKFGMRYDKYTMDELDEPYNRPSLKMKLEARYNPWDDLTLHAAASVMGGYKVVVLPISSDDGKRKAGFDLSLGADYRIFDRSSVFLQLNNVTNSHYQLYSNYPTYGIQVMLGYTCIF